jgi:hypothetical protein
MRASSLEAHESVKPKKETHYQIIKKALRKINRAEISKIIATHTPLSYHEVARRLSEMETKGMVKVVGREANVPNKPLLWALNND